MLGQRIQQLRKEKALTMTELAERAGVAKSYLSSIERDIQSNPSVQFLEKIAAVLEVDVHNIIRSARTNAEAHGGSNEPDDEWIALAREAMESGISEEQFREFLAFNKWRLQQK